MMTRDEASSKAQITDDVTTVMFFLLHYMKEHPNAIWGSHRVTEAFDAACRQLLPGSDPRKVQRMMEGIGYE